MKKIIWISFIGLLILSFAFQSHSQTNIYNTKDINPKNQINIDSTYKLFLSAENHLAELNEKLKGSFELDEPLSKNARFLEVFSREAPSLVFETNRHVASLLMLLANGRNEDKNYNEDIIKLLYNLCIEQYIIAVDSISILYIQDKINLTSYKLCIEQDFILCNQIQKNYSNPLVICLLNRIINSFGPIVSDEEQNFISKIKYILSGVDWESELKETDIIQPPLIKSKHCL
jgi:hypothetical protein